jgi:pyrroloquinoline quinone (PQQ) biosynthesis protein C
MLVQEISSNLNKADIVDSDLLEFLASWDVNYNKKINSLPLFDSRQTAKWTINQKSHFIKVLYHCRGHFHELLWFLACYAPNKGIKDIIIDNILEELGKNGFSHEQLYDFSAKAVGVDITKEYIEQETYLPFCKEFNKGHLQWLNEHNWDMKISAFAALERLDNIDYVKGRDLAESLGLSGKELTFFNVHIHVDHFETVLRGAMLDVWEKDRKAVIEAFNFISDHQAKMWENLSEEVFSYDK